MAETYHKFGLLSTYTLQNGVRLGKMSANRHKCRSLTEMASSHISVSYTAL